jgi:hypothetical protein
MTPLQGDKLPVAMRMAFPWALVGAVKIKAAFKL